ncbi:SET domain-containing protein [Amniculicola lignicola CBS 123094]|uniref:SET domain-containing protein n=1 Tax=Amniculicola lignicola CBS 123094 TaxID=1392246 RepID=A0A6A5WFT9_9PLEO|nr:SET domain-containing protein [Amniculicola lignicola CBS 123094]
MAGRATSRDSTASTSSSLLAHAQQQQPGSRTSSSASPPTSTPPTSLGDEASVLSDAMKLEHTVEAAVESLAPLAQPEAQAAPSPAPEASTPESGRRAMRASRASVTTYNVQILAGTAIHTPSKYLDKHHKNVLHGDVETLREKFRTAPVQIIHKSPKKRVFRRQESQEDLKDISDPAEAQLATEAAEAQRRKSTRVHDLRKEAFRNSLNAAGEALAHTGHALMSGGKDMLQSALGKRSRATNDEEAIDQSTSTEPEKVFFKPKTKKWLKQGLYVGQHREFDPRFSESQNRMRRKHLKNKENRVLPLPMFAGQRMLETDPQTEWRDFKLPFDTYNPLPRKVKVDGWVKLHKNRFIGDASALWKREKQDQSSCYCSVEDGCGESCHNRIMSYECDSTNCKLSPEQCGNRPFAQLKKRAKGNGYDYGVEVVKTENRGYGVRAMRNFEPHQVIVEYAGEIITQAECERRMKQVYKKDTCYYLMSFDNKMIIDATRGTIARFVNHSCEPNCEMIKWTVGSEPRMALFAGSRGITTGEELTYDYNFDPFSSKNIQACRCGTESCRGVLGPRPKHKQPEEKGLASALISGAKRTYQQLLGPGSGSGSSSIPNSPKKRKFTSMASSIMTKAQNAMAENVAARLRAEQEAAEAKAAKASRENRAKRRSSVKPLRRSSAMTLTSQRAKIVRKVTRHSLPALKTTTRTYTAKTATTPIKKYKPGALKPVTKASRFGSLSKSNSVIAKTKRRMSAPEKMPETPTEMSEDESEQDESSDDETPNITPASLRSAKKNNFTQTTLPFKPLTGVSKATASTELDFDDSDDEDVAPRRKRQATASNSVRGSGSGVKRGYTRGGRGGRGRGGKRGVSSRA